MEHRAAGVLGFQIAFLTFAAVLLTAPLEKHVLAHWQWAQDLGLPLGRMAALAIGAFLLVSVGPLRRRCATLLAAPVADGRRREIAAGALLMLLLNVGLLGASALWHWASGGEPALARAMGGQTRHEVEMRAALSTHGIVFLLLFASTVGPIVEELVFRGMLYPAWAAAWGWIAGSVATAAVFGLFHAAFWPQFMGGLVFVCVLRKTRSLRGAIYVHAINNLSLWYPLLGQFMLPENRSTGELHLWTPHIVCLAGAAILLPWYMWSARDAKVADRA